MQILGKVVNVGRGVDRKWPDRPGGRLLLLPVRGVLNMRAGPIAGRVQMSLRLGDVHLVTALRSPSREVYDSRSIFLEGWMITTKNELYKHLRNSEVYPSLLESWSTVLEPDHESDLGLYFEPLV